MAEDRSEVLKQLIPGTEDYYYYHCLHYQHTGDFNEVEKLLEQWIKRYNYTQKVQEIRNRQALLEYSKNPEESLKHIKNVTGLRFNHQIRREDRLVSYVPSGSKTKRLYCACPEIAVFHNIDGKKVSRAFLPE